MVNAAHASDSEENAQREMGIVKAAENNFTTPLKYCLSIWCILCFISTDSCC